MIFKPYHAFDTKCAVVDAHERDLDAYVELARSKSMTITHVIDTHIHADHVSAGPVLAQSENAGQLHDSIHAKLLTLPDDVEVYPAHFAGSACGAGMSGKPSSTIAFEKRWSLLLSRSRDEFIEALCEVLPKPAAMDQILRVNQGRDRPTP